MTAQSSLLDLLKSPPVEVAPYQRHSITSRTAAVEVAETLSTRQREVYDLFLLLGPMTDNRLIQETVTRYGWSPNTARARRVELTALGLIVDTGERTEGRYPSTIWKAVAR